jgi:shikimate dehydrogenase
VLHRAAYVELGIDWSYEAREVTEETLPEFLDGLDETWRGLSLTMPLKRAVVPLLDGLSERAAQAQAANTVVLEPGRRTGHNTDVPGAAAAIRERVEGPVERALILGGGATAASTLLALADLGCREVTLLVRDESRAAATVEAAGRHPASPTVELRRIDSGVPDADLLVSTIPAAAQSAEVTALAQRVRAVFDVVYDPWPTPLARVAMRTATTLVSGLDLLVHQAALQVELMTGLTVPRPEDLRRAGEQALAARGH